ncbi:MAG: T9SS type A sorting domain-containing protein [Bacteroidetes bacterium]|nr:T9SS type A sorting domain-containing protein [Bacteroidota bacterium]
MKRTITQLLILLNSLLFAQAPKLYVHIVSHNEPSDNLQTQINYTKAKNNALQMANIVDTKNVKWNLQTSDGFVLGALQYDNGGTTANDIFEILASTPYNDNIEIDPRSKNMNGRNIADQWYLLDSLGANPTHHLGGCIYATTNATLQPIDWLQYRNPIIGNVFGNSWQCSMITGAGSYPPHSNDLNDFGIFKPDTTTNFYNHNPAKNLWCMGTGCAPVLDSLDNEQDIIDLIQGQVDSIQQGLWPGNKFYVTRIMTNQREYGPLFFQKINKVIDSLNAIGSNKLEWATISEVFTAFQAWQQTPADYSQWLCGQTATGIVTTTLLQDAFTISPNPSNGVCMVSATDFNKHEIVVYDYLGKKIMDATLTQKCELNLSNLNSGIYQLLIDGAFISRIVKE